MNISEQMNAKKSGRKQHSSINTLKTDGQSQHSFPSTNSGNVNTKKNAKLRNKDGSKSYHDVSKAFSENASLQIKHNQINRSVTFVNITLLR